jgi:predicted kinase
MIIFINGSFGSGKSTVAELLASRLASSMVFDPEEVGVMVDAILKPIEKKSDFQDYPLWRTLTVQTAATFQKATGRHLVIPMTIYREDYFTEVISGLKSVDSDFHHFCLSAPKEVLHQRIVQRGLPGQKPGTWVYQQIEKAVPALESDKFAKHLPAHEKTPEELVEMILAEVL